MCLSIAVRSSYLPNCITNRLCFFYAAGSINVSNILSGKCLAKIRASNSSSKDDKCSCCDSSSSESCNSKKRKHVSSVSKMRSTVAEALEDITALFYDEDRNEIYTGNRHGLVHVWSNWCIVLTVLLPWVDHLDLLKQHLKL